MEAELGHFLTQDAEDSKSVQEEMETRKLLERDTHEGSVTSVKNK